MLQMYENSSCGEKRNSVVSEMKCRNCKHKIIVLSPLLNANRQYAHFTEKFGATMMCAVSKCKCSIAQ